MAEPLAPATPSRTDVRRLAHAHSVAIPVFFVGALLRVGLAALSTRGEASTVVLLAGIGLELVMAVTLFALARRLGEPGPALWAVSPLLHFMLGVFVFAILNARARRRLRALGVEVGVLGARFPVHSPQGPEGPEQPAV